MQYVYIFLTKLNNTQCAIDNFIIHGIYSDYSTCEKEMLKHFNNMKETLAKRISSTIETTGLECSIGSPKKELILWKDGKMTEFCIQERILDQFGG